MTHQFKTIVLASMLLALNGKAQDAIQYQTNAPRIGDQLVKRVVAYDGAGTAGEGVIWHLNANALSDAVRHVDFRCDSDSIMLYGMEPDILLKYRVSEDSLLLYGYETSLKTMNYSAPLPQMRYPLSYGDSFSAEFQGEGTYCKKQKLRTEGVLEVEADAEGCICLSEQDTLRNVLRIHQVRTASVCQYSPTDSLVDTLNRKQEIEERYLWYARGYRYPIYETVSTTYYNNLQPVSCIQKAYCMLPEDQLLLNDSVNAEILLNDSIARASVPRDIIHYDVAVVDGNIVVSYSLDEPASLHLLLCDAMGLTYRRSSVQNDAGSDYSVYFSCDGLKRGTYILYLNVNGQIYNEKVYVE